MSVYKRKSGRYAVLVDLDRKSDGNRQRRSLGTFATRKEALRAEREALSAHDRGIDLLPGTVSVASLLDRYVADREALGRGAKTLEEYRGLVNAYIRPNLGSISLAKMKPAHVSAWVGTLLKSGGRKSRPLSSKTVNHAFSLLSAALRWGVRMELVGRNVCDATTTPSGKSPETKALTIAEVTSILEVAKDTQWSNFILLALTLGARRGELLALHWSDVDLERRTVTIRGSLCQTKGLVALKSTKSGRVRVIPLSTTAYDAFRNQRVMQAQDRLALGASYHSDRSGPVFADEMGVRRTPKAATNAYSRIAKKAGASTTRLHAARHTAGTNMIAGGVDVRTTASVLGHANANITLSLYSHVVDGAERNAMDVLELRLGTQKKSS